MKRVVAFLFTVVMFLVSNPLQSFSQEQDTTKPMPVITDTAKPIMAAADTSKPATVDTTTPTPAGEVAKKPAKEVKEKKEKRNILYRIHMIGFKKRQKAQWQREGHHEFYTKSRREQKRISRHHLNPYKPSKSNKKMAKSIARKLDKEKKFRAAVAGDKEKAAQKAEEEKQAKQDEEKAKAEAEAPAEEKPKEETKPKDDKEKQKDEPKPKDDKEKPKDDKEKPKDEKEKPKEDEKPK